MEKILFNDFLGKICKAYNIGNNELASIFKCNLSLIYRYKSNSRQVSYSNALLLKEELIKRGYDIYSFIFDYDKSYLYHGSKSGIIPPIRYDYSLKKTSDFGRGFYVGESFMQSSTFISSYDINKSRIYALKIKLDNLKVLDITPRSNNDYRWIMFIAYNRGYISNNNLKELTEVLSSLGKGYDAIKGPIADDRMTTVMDKFFNNTITDIQLKEALTRLKLGNQYCFVNEKGCGNIKIIKEMSLDDTTSKLIFDYEKYHHDDAVNYANTLMNSKYKSGKTYNQILMELKRKKWNLFLD